MRLFPIGAQPINFDSTPLAVACMDVEAPLLIATEDALIFQVGIGCCTETPLIDEPDFAEEWSEVGRWSIAAGNASSNDWQNDASLTWTDFNPVVGDVYCLIINFAELSGQGVTVIIGGLSWNVGTAGEWSVTFTAEATDALTIRLNPGGSSVAMASAQLYEGPSEIGLQLLPCEDDEYPLFSTTLEDTPQYFRIVNGVLLVNIPMAVTGLEDGCFRVNVYLECGEETEGLTSSTVLRVDDSECKQTLKLRVCNDTDKMSVAAGYFEMRVRSSLVRPRWNVDLREHTRTDGRIVRDFANRTTVWEFYVELVGYHHHQFLSTLSMWDHFYLQGVEWAASGGEYAPEYGPSTTVGGVVIELRPRQELLRAEQCGEIGEGCDPAGDPQCNEPNAVFDIVPDGCQFSVSVLIVDENGFIPTGFRWTFNGVNQTPVAYTGPGAYSFGPVTAGAVVEITVENDVCPFTQTVNIPLCDGAIVLEMGENEGDPDEMRIATSSTFHAPSLAALWSVYTPSLVCQPTNGGETEDYITVFPNGVGRYCFSPSQAPSIILPNDDFIYLEFIGEGYRIIDLSGCNGMAIEHLVLANIPNIESVTLPTLTASIAYLDLSGIPLSSSDVNAILCLLDSFETTGGTVILDGPNNAPPTGSGIACASALTGKSWTVTTN
jgi:hypothetical protein